MNTSWIGGFPLQSPRDNLLEAWIYIIEAAGIRLEFIDEDQIREAASYFSQKLHGSSMRPGVTLEHYWQSWFERLPKGAHNHRTQEKLLSALESLLNGITDASIETREA